jgi:hypothetical protein
MQQYRQNEIDKSGSDIYDRLGFGYTAYFRILLCYMIMFSIFTLVCIPTFMIYNSHSGIKDAVKVQSYSLGNMGFSGSYCAN